MTTFEALEHVLMRVRKVRSWFGRDVKLRELKIVMESL